MSAVMSDVVSQFDYSSAVMLRFLNPQHAGDLASGANVLTAQAGSRERGASIRLYLQVKDKRVVQAKFVAYGCPHFIAAAEMLCEWCEGRAIDELPQWNWQSAQAELDTPASKRSKLLLLEDALRKLASGG
jgi:NifU-like protein involved in Fe-S cluster formation